MSVGQLPPSHTLSSTSSQSTESRFLKNLARGQEGGPQAKLPGAYCGIFKDRYSNKGHI